MSRKLIEQYRRKVDLDISRCIPVRLADGNEWHFPRPMLELRPRFDGAKPVALTKHVTWGEELDDIVQAIATAEPGEDLILAVLRLGGDLLLRNYDLTQGELERLFRYRVNDPTGQSDEMIKAVIDVATGRLMGYAADPKPHADGSRSLCDPSASRIAG